MRLVFLTIIKSLTFSLFLNFYLVRYIIPKEKKSEKRLIIMQLVQTFVFLLWKKPQSWYLNNEKNNHKRYSPQA